jgi:hypothetical protein
MTTPSSGAWDRARNHYLYDPASNEIRVYWNADAWTVTASQAATYVRSHLIRAARNDHPPVLLLYEATGRHPFMLLRSLLPYLTWVSELYCPKGAEADQALAFASAYMPAYAPVMRDVYTIYRHGLMHRHFPNCVVQTDGDSVRLIAWGITADRAAHLRVAEAEIIPEDSPTPVAVRFIPLVPRTLYEDVIAALEHYAAQLESDPDLLPRFLTAFRQP